jgi:hypothetical protein
MKASVKHYWKPTPKFWRQIGDSMLAAGTFGGTFALVSDYKWLGIALFICAVVGKFLTNMFKDDEPILPPDQPI